MAGMMGRIGSAYSRADAALRQRLSEDAQAVGRRAAVTDLRDMRGRAQAGGDSLGSLSEELYEGLGKGYGMDVAGYRAALEGAAGGDVLMRSLAGQYMRDKAAATAERNNLRRFLDAASQDSAGGIAIRGAGVTAAAGGTVAGLTAAGQGLLALMDYMQQTQVAAAERDNELT
jgi:hypothetical protein